jgi:hypothetical protein
MGVSLEAATAEEESDVIIVLLLLDNISRVGPVVTFVTPNLEEHLLLAISD